MRMLNLNNVCPPYFPPKNLMKVVVFSDWLGALRMKIQRSFLIFLALVFLSKIDRPLVWLICCLKNCSLESGQGGKIRKSLIEIKN